jgi:Stage II sporulation protein E (SpoIIE)
LFVATTTWVLPGAEVALAQAPAPPAPVPFSGVGIGTGTRSIDGLWQFHTGDDPTWSQPKFDDSQWERIPADSPWGDNGHPGYTGFAWYRRQIVLDPSDKTKLGILLPPLNSVAEVYWNGVKVGGLGTPPPNAFWYVVPRPVAITLPTGAGMGGNGAGTLAIRLWMYHLGSNEAPDAGGFQSAPVLGYAPLVEQKVEAWVNFRFRRGGIVFASCLIYLLVALGSLLLWLRQRSQWLFLWVALYFGTYLLGVYSTFMLGFSWVFGQSVSQAVAGLPDLSLWMLLLLVFGLQRRRFWLRFTLAMVALQILGSIMSFAEVLVVLTHPRLFHFLDVASELTAYPAPFVTLLLIAGGLFTRRLRLPQLLFAAAAALDLFLNDLIILLGQSFTRMDALLELVQRPLFWIYGSNMSVFTASKILLLMAMLNAVWDHVSQQMARRRLIEAELKSAQEVQQILVPAASSEDAPGYAVASVYRPASEVGGDFFQIVPLASRKTLIVAGDVSGKGLRAAMTVSLIVGAIRTLAEQDLSPAAILAGLNRRLIGRVQGGFATCCAVLVTPAGDAVMANAGHCQPYIDGEEIELPCGLPLGIVEAASYEEQSTVLADGAHLVLVSDGVVEARNAKGELYGFDRLKRLISEKATAEEIADAAVAFGQDDDITVLTVMKASAM